MLPYRKKSKYTTGMFNKVFDNEHFSFELNSRNHSAFSLTFFKEIVQIVRQLKQQMLHKYKNTYPKIQLKKYHTRNKGSKLGMKFLKKLTF